MRMARHLFIVAREHARLYHDLVDRFRDDTNVRVILDRRQGDRRQRQAEARPAEVRPAEARPAETRPTEAVIPGAERRAQDRRGRGEIDEQLRDRSHVIVTLSDPRANLSPP